MKKTKKKIYAGSLILKILVILAAVFAAFDFVVVDFCPV